MRNSIDALGEIKSKAKLEIVGGRVKKTARKIETERQGAYVEWTKLYKVDGRFLFDRVIHCPSEGKRGPQAQRDAKTLGLKKGVLDILLAMARGQYIGLWLEFKSDEGKATADQEEFAKIMEEEGYMVRLVRKPEDAIRITMEYLAMPKRNFAPSPNTE